MTTLFHYISDWIAVHPAIVLLALYHAISAAVGSLEMPDQTSGKFYRWFFRFANRFAANYSRAGASNGGQGT